MSDQFQRDAVRAFRFVRCGLDTATGVAELVYAFDDGPELVETVTVPGAPFVLDDARRRRRPACRNGSASPACGSTPASSMSA